MSFGVGVILGASLYPLAKLSVRYIIAPVSYVIFCLLARVSFQTPSDDKRSDLTLLCLHILWIWARSAIRAGEGATHSTNTHRWEYPCWITKEGE